MSTITLHYPHVIHVRQAHKIGLILILISLALIAGAILVIVLSPTRDAYQADSIPIARTSPDSLPVAVPIPTPPAVELHPGPSKIPVPVSEVANVPDVVAVPMPVPPTP